MNLTTRTSFFFIIIFLAMLTTVACKKTGDPNSKVSDTNTNVGHIPGPGDKVVMDAGRSGQITSFNYSQSDVDSLIKSPASVHAATPQAAVEYWTSMPPKLAIAPYLLPVTNFVSISQTDSSAMFSAEPSHAPMSMIVTLQKERSSNTAIWLVKRIEESGRNDQSKPSGR